MKVLILGAGVIGVTTAWYLRQAGHDVIVLERQPDAGMETSYANGGQVSVSHVEPWANPGAPMNILRWLGQEDAPLLFRLRADWRQWAWGGRFLLECLPGSTRDNMLQILAISRYSGDALRDLRAATGISYDDLQRGILHLYTDPEGYRLAAQATELVQRLGVERSTVTSEQCVALEPALATQAHRIVGATYTGSDESGDAGKFTQQLARMAADAGVSFRYGVTVDRLHAAGDVLTRVDITQADGRRDTLAGDAYVAALGSYTPLLVRPLGVPCPVYPLKGYSVTLPVVDAVRAPSVSVTDDARKIVISRLGERLRAAGTAELNGYNLELNTVRCAALTQCVTQWFGDSVDASAPDYWTGLRPATPSNVPLIGRTRYANLFLNTGHGTLGWTMSCGSAKALTAIMGGQAPDIGFRFLGSAS